MEVDKDLWELMNALDYKKMHDYDNYIPAEGLPVGVVRLIGDIIRLNGDVEYLGMKVYEDVEFSEGELKWRDKILSEFGISKSYLGVAEDANNASLEANGEGGARSEFACRIIMGFLLYNFITYINEAK